MMLLTGIDLAAAWPMAHSIPSRLLGLNDRELQVGHPADVVQFQLTDKQTIQIDTVLLCGNIVYGDGL